MVWLKIRKNDIKTIYTKLAELVVVWLKIRKNDIKESPVNNIDTSCGLIKD